jgi:hypothetical protein
MNKGKKRKTEKRKNNNNNNSNKKKKKKTEKNRKQVLCSTSTIATSLSFIDEVFIHRKPPNKPP